MKELRVIIAGSRDFDNLSKLTADVSDILSKIPVDSISKTRIISGTARGADQMGEQYARNAGYEISRFPADWDRLGKRAGYVRNDEMARFAVADGNTGVLIAFWDGKSKGTKHMIGLAGKYGLETHIIRF